MVIDRQQLLTNSVMHQSMRATGRDDHPAGGCAPGRASSTKVVVPVGTAAVRSSPAVGEQGAVLVEGAFAAPGRHEHVEIREGDPHRVGPVVEQVFDEQEHSVVRKRLPTVRRMATDSASGQSWITALST